MKAIKKIWNFITTLVVAAAVLLAVLLVGARLIGLHPFTVLSGSMEPTYHVGSLIYVRKTEPEDIRVGDPITFVLDENLKVATHRVIEIDAENERFYTKGDANNAPDASPVLYQNLVGRPVATIPYLGFLSNYIQTPPGMYIALALGGVLLLLVFLPDLFAPEEKQKKKTMPARPVRTSAASARPPAGEARPVRPVRPDERVPDRNRPAVPPRTEPVRKTPPVRTERARTAVPPSPAVRPAPSARPAQKSSAAPRPVPVQRENISSASPKEDHVRTAPPRRPRVHAARDVRRPVSQDK